MKKSVIFSFVTQLGARTIYFEKGRFIQTLQDCPGARRNKQELEATQVARILVSVSKDQENPTLTRSYRNVDQRLMGASSFPETYRRVCETFGLEA